MPPGVEASVKVTVCPRLITAGLTEKSTLDVASTRTPMYAVVWPAAFVAVISTR